MNCMFTTHVSTDSFYLFEKRPLQYFLNVDFVLNFMSNCLRILNFNGKTFIGAKILSFLIDILNLTTFLKFPNGFYLTLY